MAHKRARARFRSPARNLAMVLGVIVLGVAVGIGAAATGLVPPGLTDHTEAEAAPSPTTTAGTESERPAAIGPITAPSGETTIPTPKVSVSPGLDKSLYSLDDPGSPWVIVNKARPIDPLMWVPEHLDSAGGPEMVPEAARALANMRTAAADAGVTLSTGTGFRPYGFQQSLYGDYVSRWGQERADRFSARPGHSEHQTGWSVDVYGSAECRLKVCFAEERAGRWVAKYGHQHGFIVRYPANAEHITGYQHEPWHIRYVGVELATAMHEHGAATMEEFFSLPPAPEYD